MRPEKQFLTKEYLGRLNASPFFIVVNYKGLSVGHMTELRKRLSKAGAEVHIVKNSIFRIAAKEAGVGELNGALAGQLAVVTGQRTDPIGDTIDSQPDKEYAAWVSQFHRAVARSGEPCFDTVSATLCFSPEPAYDVRYERLLLPWKSESDESLVTLVSRVTWRSTDTPAAAAN